MVDQFEDDVFRVLADPTRRHVIELLVRQPRTASALAETVGVTRAAMSRHLRVLRSASIVSVATPDHDARERIYSLHGESLVAARAWLDQVHAFWTEQLSSFADHAARINEDDHHAEETP
ncbi:MAG: metalloregulator ArsR/SmtB family transcription factor [Actinomycetota bacterium]